MGNVFEQGAQVPPGGVYHDDQTLFKVRTALIKANAQRYYHTTRPREGLPRMYYPSTTSESGYFFSCYTDGKGAASIAAGGGEV